MKLAKNTMIAVADGEKLSMFRNGGDEANLQLAAVPHTSVEDGSQGSGSRQNSSGNPDASQSAEDGFSAGIVAMLNKGVLDGKIEGLVIVAAPRALGEMRKHYHKALSAKLIGEIAKDLTGHSLADVQAAIEVA